MKDVVRVDTGKKVTDHLWFTVGKTIAALGLEPGDIVEFDARVSDYIKGYVNRREYIDERELDYKLNRPTRFVMVGQAEIPEYTSEVNESIKVLDSGLIVKYIRKAGSGRRLGDITVNGKVKTVYLDEVS